MNNKFFLLDAYALIFRAYYAFINNPRVNSKGLNTSAIFGFVNTLEEVLRLEKPTHIGVAFDPGGLNFRHEMFSQYKATRQTTPEDIKKAIPWIKQILEAYKIPVIQVSGFEADDVIGTLAKKFASENNIVYMMTPDKDYAQLVDNNILMYKPSRSGKGVEIIDSNNIIEKYDIDNPIQIIDILALWGDVSDNVPGVPGIGEKTAAKLISQYKSIDNIYQNIESLKGKQKESLLQNKEQLYLSKKLVTIDLNVPVDCKFEDFKITCPDVSNLLQIFKELEFNSLANRYVSNNTTEISYQNQTKENLVQPQQLDLFSSAGINLENNNVGVSPKQELIFENNFEAFDSQKVKYIFVNSIEETKNLVKILENQKEICIDTETTGLNTLKSEIIGLSISFKENEAYYVNIPLDFEKAKEILQLFSKIFNDKQKLIIGQNLKYDISIIENYDIKVTAPMFDTMLAHYIIEPEQRHNLDTLSQKYLNYQMISISHLIGEKGKNQKNMKDIAPETVSDYSCEDADITFKLKNIFATKIKEINCENLLYNIEMPLINVLISMEKTGVKLDIEAINEYSTVLTAELKEIEQNIYQLAGEKFNIASPLQLGIILFERLKVIDNPKKTKTKQYSTGEEELQKLVNKHPIINKILEFREINKLLNTYIDVFPTLINPKTNKIHTTYNQAITSTGRLSSTAPNLQNIPVRDERGKEIRKSFIASDENHIFYSADYSQIELRIMAHLSKDKNMLEAFNKFSMDIHTATAAKIFKVSEDEVTKDMRRKAKTANFGIIYGISAFGLAERLQISRTEAKSLIDNYFETFPEVKTFMNKSIELARETGYVETIFGRRRYLADINSNNSMVRGFAERNAINAPIQGSAADIIKLAMVNIFNRFDKEYLQSKMILQVHDELNFDVLISEQECVKDIVVFEMQNVMKLDVPLIVDAHFGKNWAEAH